MNEETKIQNTIQVHLNKIGITFRANVGTFQTKTGRRVSTGLPNGFPDLFGFRKSDGRIFFIEVKTNKGKLSKNQIKMRDMLLKHPVIYGVARSKEDAIAIVEEKETLHE